MTLGDRCIRGLKIKLRLCVSYSGTYLRHLKGMRTLELNIGSEWGKFCYSERSIMGYVCVGQRAAFGEVRQVECGND